MASMRSVTARKEKGGDNEGFLEVFLTGMGFYPLWQYIYLLQLMFPQIAKRKKKEFVVDESITRQWQQASKDLQLRSKAALKRIPHAILQDFGKVCRIKSIPEFYANYFICSTQRLDSQQLSLTYAEEIQRLLTNNSHFHRVNHALRQREELIEGLKKSMVIVEGFMLMNQNKAVPIQIKSSIDALVSECFTLEELKDLERKKTEELAKDIIRVRTNTAQLVQLVVGWREDLEKNANEGVRKVKAIYPHQAINCLLMPLYDLLFIRSSALKAEFNFGKDEHDPFIEKIGKNKKGSQIQDYLIDYLKADTTDYSKLAKVILEQLPNEDAEKMREKEIQYQMKKEERLKEQKLKEEKLKQMRQEKQKEVRIRHYSSVKTLKEGAKEDLSRNVNSKTSRGQRSERKIINIDKLIKEKSVRKSKQQSEIIKDAKINENESKVLGAYKKIKKGSMDQSVLVDKGELLQEKKIWEKQMKEEKEEKEKIRKLLRQTEKKAMQETKLFEDKLKRYEEEVQNLKTRVQQSKKVNRIASSVQKSRVTVVSPDKPKKSIASAYKSQAKSKEIGPSILESKLAEQSKVKKNLEKQIKQLAKEKLKMQKLIQKQSIKASKEVQINKRQIQKYEEVINKLKSQTENSRKIIHELETSKNKEEKKNADSLRNSIIRQKQEVLKKNIEEKIIEKQRKKKSFQSSKIQETKKSYSTRKKSLETLKQGNQSVIDKSVSVVDDSKLQILKSKLQQQSKAKKSLQTQIKQLAQEKIKLQKFIERQNVKTGKEVEKTNKRIEKYEQTINRLKQQTQDSRRVISVIESSKIQQQKRSIEKSRVESVKNRELQLKRKIQQKIEQRQRRKKAQKAKNEESIKSQERRLSNSKDIGTQKAGFSNEDIEIIKTKQTIEIVFEPKKRKAHPSKELIQAEQKLVRLQRQRDLLEKKLQFSIAQKKEQTNHLKGKVVAERSQIAAKFQEQIERQREKNNRLQENIKKMRKNVSTEYELRLNKEKMKYEKERQELLKVIEKEREEKKSKDRVLQQQMNFLKEMEKKENELFELLQREKLEKQRKEMMLNRELEQKEELMNMLQLQQIKKGIERQVRRQIEENESQQQEQDLAHQQRKMKLEQQIDQLRIEKQNQIEEMNNQNEKLRDLISQIKVQENNLLEAIKENIDMESDTQREADHTDNDEVVKQSPKIKSEMSELQELKKQNEHLSKELQSKTMIQFKNEEKKRQKYTLIQNSDNFKDKEKIQNLVEFYLNSPQQFVTQKQSRLKESEKQEIIRNGSQKARLIEQFQTQLFSLKEMPDYVPSLKNDSITNHLLNLREAYEDYEADSLRRELFPPLQEQVYGQKELSVQSEQPPINTIMDEVRDHLKKHPLKKEEKGSKKNFLAINRVRLSVLQDVRKEKQRNMIEEESRKKIQKELFDKRRRQREEKLQRERLKDIQKEKQREEIYNKQKEKTEKERIKEKKRKQQKLKKRKEKQQKKSDVSHESKEKSPKKRVASSKDSNQSRGKVVQNIQINAPNPVQSSQTEKDKSDHEEAKFQEIQPINEEQVEQSLQKQEAQLEQQVKQYEQQLQKKEKELLKEQIKQVQQEVRAYINDQEQFQIYQQFVSESQLTNRIQQFLDLSSTQIKHLNGNDTIKQDVTFYSTMTILVAKNAKGIQVGLAVFHKELSQGLYVCDYLIAHNMEHFLTLAFNFSRFIFRNDRHCTKIQFIFNLKSIVQPNTLKNFLEFEKKCRRLGEVYIKAKSDSERKYVLRRNLFEATEEKIVPQTGINFNLTLNICGSLLRQINQGFKNASDLNYCSYSIILAYYLSKRQEKLMKFRERAEHDLIYRQLLVTSLLFQKKELQIKNFAILQYRKKFKEHLEHLKERFDLSELDSLQQTKLSLEQKLPKQAKRCTLQVGYEQVNYLLLSPQEATTSIQSSNSSENGYFLSIVPKYKLMIIEAEEFLTMSSKNPDLTAFFYIKHFIKNIVDVKKQKFQRVYLPQIHKDDEFHLSEIGQKMKETVLLKENIDIGWKGDIPNSVTFTPRHQDLVIQKPFIMALLSGPVERAVEGSPICVQVIL